VLGSEVLFSVPLLIGSDGIIWASDAIGRKQDHVVCCCPRDKRDGDIRRVYQAANAR
jgi:hypothetical protein